MQRLGYTRSSHQPDHLLLTPDTFVRAPRPGMQGATAIVHVSPSVGAKFTHYTAEFELGGSLSGTTEQRFLYVLEGEIRIEDRLLGPQEYAYLPAGYSPPIVAQDRSKASVIEKPYVELEGVKLPSLLIGNEGQVTPKALMDDRDLEVRCLLPDSESFDFAVNTMTYQPGATLPMVEMHIMEHGLVMLEGGGIYRLGEKWYPVTAGDFIWMAPYCPQWFGALGKVPAKYLIYKDWNR
jgi:(S)-ureidoglycine aminohydrolase